MKIRAGMISLIAAAVIVGACQTATDPEPAAETAPQESTAPAETEVQVDPTPDAVVATGVFKGRSGKLMSGAKLVLGAVSGDTQFPDSLIKLAEKVATATVDKEGGFEFKGFAPGRYTIIYLPQGAGSLFPTELRIKALAGTVDSIAPLLVDAELGTTRPFGDRDWGRRFTLLEGHTLFSKGAKMTAYNATVRVDPRGPYLEMRRGRLWSQELEDNSEIEFEAWSY